MRRLRAIYEVGWALLILLLDERAYGELWEILRESVRQIFQRNRMVDYVKKNVRRVRKGSPGVRGSGKLDARPAGKLTGRAAELGRSYAPTRQGPKMVDGVRQR